MSSDKRNLVLLILLFAVAIGGYIYWWLQNHELVEQEFRLRPSKEVRENPFHAAQLFLERKGYPVELSNGLNRFQALPATDDIIIGEYLGGRLPDHRVDELLAWVEQGGQILTSVQRSWIDDDPGGADKLLNKLGLTLWAHDYDEQEDSEEWPDFEVVTTTLQNGTRFEAEFDYGLSLYDPDWENRKSHHVSSETSTYLLAVPHGKGWVMMTTDLEFMRNPREYTYWENSEPSIHQRDHAFMLSWLVESVNTVWMVRGVDAEPITKLIWQHGRHAVIALLVLLLFWLWWLYNRFGPLRASVTPERRNILEHLQMSAVFAWRQDRAQKLFSDTRHDIELLLRRKHPQIANLPVAERSAKLADLLAGNSRSENKCHLTIEQITRALHHDWQGEREFIELTHLLQQIRKTL
ncbi:DUF4350 domain-containing protein [Porticoccus sp. W117]|uniref:DUF4350 domain-containing protein n=1 Tax=Porticoccus sp. W117 TaxID=3054777 RepID=UPI0025984345|nr:DUF4350 domain-containing protein [Porticoccus sp. W117]MDM3871367.1 DUF4350 domain-containing protein [Porticoccus sp. W117]